jgi:hypothetical protein
MVHRTTEAASAPIGQDAAEGASPADHNFPRHDFDPATFECRRCLRGEFELACSALPISCMSDAEIFWTNQRAERLAKHMPLMPDFSAAKAKAVPR